MRRDLVESSVKGQVVTLKEALIFKSPRGAAIILTNEKQGNKVNTNP